MHEPDLQPAELCYCAIAIRLEHLKVGGESISRPARTEQMFFGHQCADPDAFEPPSRQTGFEARVEHRNGHEPFVVPHARSIGAPAPK